MNSEVFDDWDWDEDGDQIFLTDDVNDERWFDNRRYQTLWIVSEDEDHASFSILNATMDLLLSTVEMCHSLTYLLEKMQNFHVFPPYFSETFEKNPARRTAGNSTV